MTYDLTLFSTIASASASFVAIIGGFMASKLIAVNSDRSGVLERLKENQELLQLKTKAAEELAQQLAEDDAYDFIKENIDSLSAQSVLEEVYQTNKKQRIEFDELLPYWETALRLIKRFDEEMEESDDLNEDSIPVALAIEVKDKWFEYRLCELFGEYHDDTKWAIMHSIYTQASSNDNWYGESIRSYEALLREIDVLELERAQLERRKSSLQCPSNIIWGLCIFGIISVLSILLPLIFMRLIPTHPSIQGWTGTLSIICMSLSLASTFFYMWKLLKWKDSD